MEHLAEIDNDAKVLKAHARSRHVSKQINRVFIRYRPTENALECALGHPCSYAMGSRTIGSCSHVFSIFYYLTYVRYLSKIVRPAEILIRLFEFTDLDPVIDEHTDDEEQSERVMMFRKCYIHHLITDHYSVIFFLSFFHLFLRYISFSFSFLLSFFLNNTTGCMQADERQTDSY